MTEHEYAVQLYTGEFIDKEDEYNARCDTLAACIDRMLVDPKDCIGVAAISKECDWQILLTDELELTARFVFVVHSNAKKVDVDKKKFKSYFSADFPQCSATKKLVNKRQKIESASESCSAPSAAN